MRIAALFVVLLLAACRAPSPTEQNAAGLTQLPCAKTGPLRPITRFVCDVEGHNYVTPQTRASLTAVAEGLARKHPGSFVAFMEASESAGKTKRQFIHAHGDGRHIDLAFFYETTGRAPLAQPPRPGSQRGYAAYEPPQYERERVCVGVQGWHARPDPRPRRRWRLDEARTADLIRLLLADPNVKAVFIEPHLKKRLGFAGEPKIVFAGCQAMRYDDHLHVDFWK